MVWAGLLCAIIVFGKEWAGLGWVLWTWDGNGLSWCGHRLIWAWEGLVMAWVLSLLGLRWTGHWVA
jgi:hypothetical protein